MIAFQLVRPSIGGYCTAGGKSMPHRLLPIMLVCLLTACGKSDSGTSQQADLSSPKAALKTYGQAMRTGDVSTAQQAVTGVDPKAVELLARLGSSRTELDNAAVARFGEEGGTLAGGEARPYGEGFQKMLAEADVKIDGDTATVTQHSGQNSTTEPASQTAKPIPLILKKVGGDWKLDYAAMENTRSLADSIPMMQLLLKANTDLAAEIKAGNYASLAQAKEARLEKLRELLGKRPATVATQPDR